MALFVAPTLLDAAYDASPRDLKRNLVSVIGLAIVLVIVTIAVVAWAARLAVPGMGWAPAIALGDIVAPPDASAAAAVLRKLRPPHRLMVILEGESLFNDATSLLIYRLGGLRHDAGPPGRGPHRCASSHRILCRAGRGCMRPPRPAISRSCNAWRCRSNAHRCATRAPAT